MRITAQSGRDRFLLDLEDGFSARVADLAQGTVSEPVFLLSILNRGQWRAYRGPQRAEELIAELDVREFSEADAQLFEAQRHAYLREHGPLSLRTTSRRGSSVHEPWRQPAATAGLYH